MVLSVKSFTIDLVIVACARDEPSSAHVTTDKSVVNDSKRNQWLTDSKMIGGQETKGTQPQLKGIKMFNMVPNIKGPYFIKGTTGPTCTPLL